MSKRRASRPRRSGQRGSSVGSAPLAASNASLPVDAEYRWQWLPRGTLLALLLLVACQPISGDGLWWQASRGRAVWQGQLQPTASLLALESAGEADWLGGLPLYAVCQVLGADGWMLFRLALFAIVAGCLWKSWRDGRWASPLHLILCGLTAIALSSSLGLQPTFYDLLGIGLLPLWLQHRLTQATSRTALLGLGLGLGLAFALWSNLATGFVWGALLCLVGLLDGWRRKAISSGWLLILLAAIAIGGSGNPRGVMAWSDSLQTLLPFLPNPAYVLAGTPWGTMLQNDWGWREIFFLALTAAWIVALLIDRNAKAWSVGVGDLLGFAIVQWFAWASLQNLPPAILWLAANLASRWPPQAVRSTVPRWAVPTVVLFAAASSSGLLGSCGWGVARRQDYRLLQNALLQTEPYGTAFADQTRSAAMLAWILPGLPAPPGDQPPMQLQDIPLHAVRRGRLEQHGQLLSDLKRNRLMRYWRTDGSAGGYWLTFDQRDTTLLCVSDANFEVIRGLEETVWKPLSLDSAVIPFAIAGEEAYVRQMIRILQDRETIEHRFWQYEPARSSGSEFDRDRLGLALPSVAAEAVGRQAEVFRAMNLHYAALRVLVVGRELFPDDSALQHSFWQCQCELADQERIDAGSPSWFRRRAAAAAAAAADAVHSDPHASRGQAPRTEGASIAWLDAAQPARSVDSLPADAQALPALVDSYLEGGAPAMLRASSLAAYDDVGPDVLYGCLCAAIESGQYELADRLLAQLRKHSLTSPLRELVLAREIEYRPERFQQANDSSATGHQGQPGAE